LLADIPRKTWRQLFDIFSPCWSIMILYGMINRICDTEGRSSTKCFMAGLTFGYLWPGGHPYSIQFFHAAASSNQRFGDPASSNCFQNISKSKDVHSPTDMWHERLMKVDSGISPILDWFIHQAQSNVCLRLHCFFPSPLWFWCLGAKVVGRDTVRSWQPKPQDWSLEDLRSSASKGRFRISKAIFVECRPATDLEKIVSGCFLLEAKVCSLFRLFVVIAIVLQDCHWLKRHFCHSDYV
jgi:hypothetical protein